VDPSDGGSALEEPVPGHAPHVFVAELDRPILDPGDLHHLTRVLRTRVGDDLTISDGDGRWRACRLTAEAPEPTGPIREVRRSLPALTIAFALVKGQKPELVVQKLTELGLDVIVPFIADRSVVRWDPDRAAAHGARLRRVAREAAMQSRRCWLPQVAPLMSFDAVIALAGASMAERGGEPPTLAMPTVVIGPEGGWSDEERRAEVPIVGLGANVLRSETAALAAGVAMTGLRAGLWIPPAVLSSRPGAAARHL